MNYDLILWYLRALDVLTKSELHGLWARAVQRELTLTDVHIGEYIEPIHHNPHSPEEVEWKRLTESLRLRSLKLSSPHCS